MASRFFHLVQNWTEATSCHFSNNKRRRGEKRYGEIQNKISKVLNPIYSFLKARSPASKQKEIETYLRRHFSVEHNLQTFVIRCISSTPPPPTPDFRYPINRLFFSFDSRPLFEVSNVESWERERE